MDSINAYFRSRRKVDCLKFQLIKFDYQSTCIKKKFRQRIKLITIRSLNYGLLRFHIIFFVQHEVFIS